MKTLYKPIKNLLSQDFIEFITSSSLRKINQSTSFDRAFIDDQVTEAYSLLSSKYFLYRELLHFFKKRIEHESNLKLNPTYSYSRIYLSGANLERHIDRPACEISMSLTLKYKYNNKNYKWPLCMGETPLVIESGDGVIYKGREIQHWRPIFTEPDGSWHHQAFFHYVNKDGPCKNLKEEIDEESISFNDKEQKRIKKQNL